jgi:hypothetical protein
MWLHDAVTRFLLLETSQTQTSTGSYSSNLMNHSAGIYLFSVSL